MDEDFGESPPLRLARLSNGRVSIDGETIIFRIETTNGEFADIECALNEVGDIFNFLGTLAKAAGELRESDAKSDLEPRNYLNPVPAQGLGFAPSPDPESTILVLRLFGFDLGFSVPSSGLAEIGARIAQTGLTLSAKPGRPN